MRRLPLVSTPPSIALADEQLDDVAASAAASFVSTDGFEVVPAWQARPPRRVRQFSAVVPLVAVAAAAALWIGHDDDARALRERPAAAVASETSPTQALVVSAAPAPRAGSRRSGR
jgi:hypothetical protein